MQKNIVALRKHTRLDVSPGSNMRIYQAVIHLLAPSDAWSCRTSCILFCHALLLLIHARLACAFAKSKCALRLFCRSTDNSRKTLYRLVLTRHLLLAWAHRLLWRSNIPATEQTNRFTSRLTQANAFLFYTQPPPAVMQKAQQIIFCPMSLRTSIQPPPKIAPQ